MYQAEPCRDRGSIGSTTKQLQEGWKGARERLIRSILPILVSLLLAVVLPAGWRRFHARHVVHGGLSFNVVEVAVRIGLCRVLTFGSIRRLCIGFVSRV